MSMIEPPLENVKRLEVTALISLAMAIVGLLPMFVFVLSMVFSDHSSGHKCAGETEYLYAERYWFHFSYRGILCRYSGS